MCYWHNHAKSPESTTSSEELLAKKLLGGQSAIFDRVSVTKIVQDLGWRTLDQRRADACLCLFYKIIHDLEYIQYSNRVFR